MALPMLVGNGAECGPSNPLQGLSKRFDVDRGVQQDHFGASRAGSSREAFRTHGVFAQDQDAAQFFAGNTSMAGPRFVAEPGGFDLSAMHAALPAPAIQREPVQAKPMSSWAADFMQLPAQAPLQPLAMAPVQKLTEDRVLTHSPASAGPQHHMQWTPAPAMSAFRANTMPAFIPHAPIQHQAPHAIATQRISWDSEFNAQELQLASASTTTIVQEEPQIQQQEPQHHQSPHDGDELARTAGMLLENVKHEQNPKFQKSQFMGLMKQLRDGEVIVEGNRMVESDGRTSAEAAATAAGRVDVKGKGRAIDPSSSTPAVASAIRLQSGRPGYTPAHAVPTDVLRTAQIDGQKITPQAEDPLDAYFRQENEDYARYWSEAGRQRQADGVSAHPEAQHWDQLQNEWDKFDSTTNGIRAVSSYRFQENNPYLTGDASATQHHLLHAQYGAGLEQNVLALEAAVQLDPQNAAAWYELGVKQQENEREHKALQALQRAVALDPTHMPSWLALAISYTNDNNRQGAHDGIYEWVTRNVKYQSTVQQFRAQSKTSADASLTEKYAELIQCLIMMATSDAMGGEVDADVQIALAVLLNTNEEYAKATDCFRTALAVRPSDWLLYNRVGATMANSGQAEEALNYYYRALELNPGYIRARFNLGISCINLRRYDEAAHHILDALELQENDGLKDNSSGSTYPLEERGTASAALWDSLKTTCLHMQRADLATLCEQRNIEAFRHAFFGE